MTIENSTNALLEAAQDILAKSKSEAPSMPPQKLAGEIQDLGGPTPENSRPTDDSNKLKINPKDYSKKNKADVASKPSDASTKTESTEYNSDISMLFANAEISEEFKTKATTIFEARVLDKVNTIKEQLEEEYASMLEEAVSQIKEELTTKVDDYLSYVVEQWLEDNSLAVESGLRAEITEDFILGLKNLFVEHYIEVPTDKVDLVDELASKVEELETKLDEEIQSGIEMRKQLVESRKENLIHAVCEGLTDTQVEKIKSLAESINYSTEEEYIQKLETIRENYFPTSVKKVTETHLNEQWEDDTNKTNTTYVDPFVAAVSQAISKTKI
jgi:hypothetical protein